MRRVRRLLLGPALLALVLLALVLLALVPALLLSAPTEGAGVSDRPPPLVLEAVIRLEDTAGRLDHMAVDLRRGRLFVAELGNGSIDVTDLVGRRVTARISGLKEPQGIGYSDRADLVVVASAGDGSVRFYAGADLTPAGAVALGSDADNVRIERRSGNVVVGHGSGGLAILDPTTRKVVADISLPAHPEGFQLDASDGRAFVNIPDAQQIAVVDLQAGRTEAVWRVPGARSNFPMALTTAGRLLATVFRNPPSLVLIDARTGAEAATLPACGDADDVFFDERRQRVYVSCGNGEVDTWEHQGDRWQPMSPIKTGSGARTSLFIPELDRLVVAQRAAPLGRTGAIAVYRPAG